MPTASPGDSVQPGATPRFLLTVSLIALILLAKFVTYAWLVTPLWDIPDESGHYSYVEDTVRGDMPVLGQARMGKDVTHSWIGPNAKPGLNWIAQHPPTFYVLDAPSVMAARAAGLDFEQQVRSARMLSSLFGALTILGMALFIARATDSEELGLAVAIFFAATPMFTHLCTGVTHDTMVACTATWGAYWCVRWLESNRFRHLLYCGALVAVCTVTKLTGLAMAVPLFFALAWRLRQIRNLNLPDAHRWLWRSTALWLVMFVPMCLWIIRNLTVLGSIFPDTSVIYGDHRVPIGFFEYMHRFPFWQHTLLNFIALVGWNGSGHGVLKWIHANGAMARYFLAFFLATGLSVMLRSARLTFATSAGRVASAALVLVLAYVCTLWPLQTLATWTCFILLAALLCTLGFNASGFMRGDNKYWLLGTAAICVLFFAFVYYEHLWAGFSGVMRATHGRYLYPVTPFLLLALAWPFRGRVASRTLLCGAVLAMVFADGFFLHQVFHLYGQI